MSDRIQKFLRTLSEKRRREIEQLVERIVFGTFDGLDVKKLRGSKDVYRVRKGDIRIIFRMRDDDVFVLAIERRSDTTYRAF